MIAPNFKRGAVMARLSSAVYTNDLKAISMACAKEGLEYVGIVMAPGFQALVARNTGIENVLIYRGTPVTCGRDIVDAIEALEIDAGLTHETAPGGGRIMAGVYHTVYQQWQKILPMLDMRLPLRIGGHSLGAVLALTTGMMVPYIAPLEVVAFAPFQCADGKFWNSIYSGRPLPLAVGRARDFVPGHDHVDPVTTLAGQICHIDKGSWAWANSWPFLDESIPDHAVDLYVADVENLAGA